VARAAIFSSLQFLKVISVVCNSRKSCLLVAILNCKDCSFQFSNILCSVQFSNILCSVHFSKVIPVVISSSQFSCDLTFDNSQYDLLPFSQADLLLFAILNRSFENLLCAILTRSSAIFCWLQFAKDLVMCACIIKSI